VTTSPDSYYTERLDGTLLRDRPRLRSLLRALRHGRGDADVLEAEVAASRARVAARHARLPDPVYPADLPISSHLEAIGAALADHPVVVVAGATGSGKTTQLPKLCLALGRGVLGQVGHTQPRRLAARSVAARIAEELGSPLGDMVGYKVRFNERSRPETLVKLMTDGILLNELQRDRLLLNYDTLIIDEAHERSLNVDFILGYLKNLLPRRPDLRVIVTSATIDTARIAAHFGSAPVVEVEGRSWPIKVRYRPLAGDDDERDRSRLQGILAAVDELAAEDRHGDILVFLPGEREIRETAEGLRKHHPPKTEILPLYARLAASEQARVFAPGPGQRVVLSTNVAETSLTVPGIRHVVDTGVARISRYGRQGHVQRLMIEPVSRASADQRKGRCGRLGPGVCIRLYDEEEFLNRPEFTDPEILRTGLAAVILQMEAYGLGNIDRFPFLDPPDPRRIRDGYRQLIELGALDEHHALTPLGRRLARLPLDPRLGRMLLDAAENGCLSETLIIVAGLAVQDPRERPHDASAAADTAHAALIGDASSDFLALLALWRAWCEQRKHLSQNKLRKWCRTHFLGYLRLREWQEIHKQLDHLLRDMGLHPNEAPAKPDTIHRALLSGLVGQVARRGEKRLYHGVGERQLQLFPGSLLAAQPPPWIVAAEWVETRRLYARTVAPVRPQWIEAAAGDRVRRDHLEPHWVARRGQVIAYERVTFRGLVLVARRRINFGPVDPVAAREIFIREALIDGRLETRGDFLQHNRALVAGIEALEAKTRRRDLLAGEEVVYRFYDTRLPPSVYDRGTFEAWRRRIERRTPKQLWMERELLLLEEPDDATVERYPDSLAVQRLHLPLHYAFTPDDARDGVTADVPLAALGQLLPAHLDWLVPGLLAEKVTWLLRALPKGLRRQCVPVPETANACLARLVPGDRPLLEQLRDALFRLRGLRVPAGAWDGVEPPAHLTMHIRVVDEAGQPVAAGDNLEELQHELGTRASASRTAGLDAASAAPFTTWNCGPLAERVVLRQAGIAVDAWPALAERGHGVVVEMHGDPGTARIRHRHGLRRLFELALADELRHLRRQLPDLNTLKLQFAAIGDSATLLDDLLKATIDRGFVDDAIRDGEAFSARLAAGRPRLATTAGDLAVRINAILTAQRAVATRLADTPPAWADAVDDLRDQLTGLVYPGFISATPAAWLERLPRYLQAAGLRLDKLAHAPRRDRERMDELTPWLLRWRTWRTDHPDAADTSALNFRWLLEEYRVALFAQEVKTALPISARRLERYWAELTGAGH